MQIEDYIVLILEVKVTSRWTTQAQKGSLVVKKGEGHFRTGSDANLPVGLFAGIRLGWKMHAQERTLRYAKHRPCEAWWLAKGNLEEMPHKSDSNYRKGATLSLSLPVWLSTCTLFPSNKHLTVSLLSFFVGIYFCKAIQARALSLATASLCVCVCVCVCVSVSRSVVRLFVILWTIACQAPPHGILQRRILE